MNEVPAKTSGVVERPIDLIVVEDDDDCRAMICESLAAHRCVLRSFSGAEEAFASAHEHVPDVVVTDLQLGGQLATGWTLADMLRRHRPTAHVALIAVTGRVEPRLEVVRAFDAYLRKPVDLELLRNLVIQLARVSRDERNRKRMVK
jgi:putative two-component system response regulator